MKIIGQTEDGYIVEISKQESAKIYDGKKLNYNERIPTGTEIDLEKAFTTLDTLRRLDNVKLQFLVDNLQKALDTVEEARNNIHAVTFFDTLSTTKEN